MKNTKNNKIFLIMPTAIFLATVLALSILTIPTFAQSEGGAAQDAGQTGQDMQQGAGQAAQDAGQSANQTGEGMQEGASDVGSKITEGAKDLAGNLGEGIQNLGK
jgi:type IV secretory pathway TrbL component